MMDIIIRCIVLRHKVKRVPGYIEPAVVVYDFKTACDEKEDSLAEVGTCNLVGEGGADGVHEEAFEGVVVLATEGVGSVEEVVAGMNFLFAPVSIMFSCSKVLSSKGKNLYCRDTCFGGAPSASSIPESQGRASLLRIGSQAQ
jgi:hypothetical protein